MKRPLISKFSALLCAFACITVGPALADDLDVNPEPGLIILDIEEDLVATYAPGSEPVTYVSMLAQGDPGVQGQSIAALIEGTPLFPPVEGLPEPVWKDQTCANCHQWDQANLCTQAEFYLKPAGAENLIKPHPYGGSFKANLKRWAEGGCP